MIKQLKHWFSSLSDSEQRLMKGGGLLVLVALLWVGVYKPVSGGISQRVELKNRLTNELDQMQSLVQKVTASPLKDSQPIPNNMTFSAWIDQQLQVVNLQQNVNRTEPIDVDSLSVWLQGVSFNQVIDWLHILDERYGVQVDQIDINIVDISLGLTDIRMRLIK